MCGINGIYLFQPELSKSVREDTIRSMNASLSHRGPDASAVWSDEKVSLGHTRLSILDLSPDANQPMRDISSRFVLIYNGELYNYRELKFNFSRAASGSGLKPYVFQTNSDSEVILAAYARYGKDCLKYFNGMFSFAVWDREKKELFAARDRFGEKPFYYLKNEKGFIFSSELRPILNSGWSNRKISKLGLQDYLMYQCIQDSNTLVSDIYTLSPGHYLCCSDNSLEINKWWDPTEVVNNRIQIDSYDDVKSSVKELVFSSVERRMVSDVPIGAFLSGGIDSSLIVAAMAQHSANPVDTFHVRYDQKEYSENDFAQIVAKKYNTRHHEINISSQSILSDLNSILLSMDTPGGDGVNSYIVSKAAKDQGVTVTLSGLGSDEFFCGYSVFSRLYWLESKRALNLIPRFIRSFLGELLTLIKHDVSTEKISTLLSLPLVNFEYAYPVSRQVLNNSLVKGLLKGNEIFLNSVYKVLRTMGQVPGSHHLSKYTIAEVKTYLSPILLRDTDQMSMANSFEVRSPYLDIELTDYLLRLPDRFKFPAHPKKLLIDSMGHLLPNEIISRSKMGFTFPWDIWMRNELNSFCKKHLEFLSGTGIVNGEVVMALWNRFLKGDRRVGWSRIWHLVVLGFWIQQNKILNA
jgi:asparagine synthase (glutamine-hydrolysing)